MWATIVTYCIFILLGIGCNLPWNVFITATSYFQHRLINTSYQDTFLNWFSMIFNSSSLLVMILRTTVLRNRKDKATVSALSGLAVITIIIGLHCILATQPQIHGDLFFDVTILSIMIIAISTVYFNDGILRILSNFPPMYTQGMVIGQAVAGVGISISNFCILYFKTDSDQMSKLPPVGMELLSIPAEDSAALIYFLLVFIAMIICVFTFIVFMRMDIFQKYHKSGKPAKVEFDDAHHKLLENSIIAKSEHAEQHVVASKIRYQLTTITLTFVVTLAVFPGITSSIRSVHQASDTMYSKFFVPLTFVLFNFGDFFGRMAAPWIILRNPETAMHISIARLLFFPLLMLCNIQDEHGHVLTHILFGSDTASTAFITLLSFTNGWLCTSTLMEYPDLLNTEMEKEMGGTLMYFCLSCGLCGGALLSFVLKAMLFKS